MNPTPKPFTPPLGIYNEPPRIRWMIRRDVPEVLQIERSSTRFSWEEGILLGCLRNRNCIGMVADQEEMTYNPLKAYMVYWLHEDYIELARLVVGKEWQRQDIGTSMIDKVKSKLSVHRRTRLIVNVAERDLPLQLFLKKQEFKCISLCKDFFYYPEGAYEGAYEDMYLFEYKTSG